MKNVILAAMAVLSLTGPANANGWDYFWGTTLNPANTGWNDFWYQCQDPNKTTDECAVTVITGILGIAAIPVAIAGVGIIAAGTAISAAAAIPVVPTVLGIPVTILTAGPAMAII